MDDLASSPQPVAPVVAAPETATAPRTPYTYDEWLSIPDQPEYQAMTPLERENVMNQASADVYG